MRYLRTHPTLRYGLIAAIVNTALLGVDRAVRALNPAIIQSPQGRRGLTIAFFSSVALVTLAAGYLTAHETGRAKAEPWAGALAVGLPATLLASIYAVSEVATHNKPLDTYAIAAVFLVFAGALAGYLVAALGGLAGRMRYRQAHREEVAALAAQRAAARARWPKRKMSVKEYAATWLIVIGAFAILLAPMGLTYLAPDYLSKWQGLVASAVALLVGYGLLRLADRADWQGYIYDFVGITLIVSGLMVGIGEITGYAILLLAGPGGLAYFWRANDRSLGNRKPSPTDPPERTPALFRNDGESIVIFPARRILARYVALTGGVALVCGALTVIFRGANPIVPFSLGCFALMGLVGFLPSSVRMLHRWPTLIVTSDGVTDLGSAWVLGFGLIPWHEYDGVVGGLRPAQGAAPDLLIIPVNFERLIARQPLLKRALLRLGSAMRGGSIAISSYLLAAPPADVAAQIRTYVKSHAPASYLEQEDDEDAAADLAPPDAQAPHSRYNGQAMFH